MHKVLATLSIVVLFACGHVPETRYFLIHYQSEPQSMKKVGGTLVVKRFSSERIYNQDKFVYRPSDYEVKFDNYRRWTTLPSEMLTEQAVAHLRASGLFDRITMTPPSDFKFLELSANIQEFDEVVQGQDRVARIALWVSIKKFPERELVWEGLIKSEQPIVKPDTEGIVEAVSKATQVAFNKMTKVLSTL